MNTSKQLASSKSKGIKNNNSLLNNSSEYENYEEDLNNYRERSQSKIQEWNLIQSRYITDLASGAHKKDKNKIEKVKNSTGDNIEGEKKMQQARQVKTSLQASKTKYSHTNYENIAGTYSYKIFQQFQCINGIPSRSPHDINKKSNQQLKKQLAEMRKMLYQLNQLVNKKLNKYQLVDIERKGMMNINEPQKQQQLLKATIETNHKVIEGLEKQIEQLAKRDKQLQQRDYLIQLQERANQIMRFISGKKKQTHHKGVVVEKLDAKLIQMRDQALDGQYKEIKVLKHQILHFFKKFHQNKNMLDQLQKKYEQLGKRDEEINVKLAQMAKMAEQKNLLVKANRQYLNNKKTHDELMEQINKIKKKTDINGFSNDLIIQKYQKQVLKMRKQVSILDDKIDQITQNSQGLSNDANELIQKYNIGGRMLKSISYKFAETLLLKSASPRVKITPDSRGNNILQESSQAKKTPYYIKPKLHVSSSRNRKLNKSQQTVSRYQNQTIDVVAKDDDKNYRENANKTIDMDKNIKNTSSLTNSPTNKFRINMKPNIHIKKNKKIDDIDTGVQSNQVDLTNLHKPKRFGMGKNRSKKTMVPTGPLSDDYMKKLQEKGRKNLQEQAGINDGKNR